MHDIALKQIFFLKLPELDPDPDLVVKFPDPDPAKRSGSDRIRIRNTDCDCRAFLTNHVLGGQVNLRFRE
jgi:hypothetical protein